MQQEPQEDLFDYAGSEGELISNSKYDQKRRDLNNKLKKNIVSTSNVIGCCIGRIKLNVLCIYIQYLKNRYITCYNIYNYINCKYPVTFISIDVKTNLIQVERRR